MNKIVVERKVNNDGVLHLTLPLGAGNAGLDVRVTVERLFPKPEMTPDEWRRHPRNRWRTAVVTCLR